MTLLVSGPRLVKSLIVGNLLVTVDTVQTGH